MVFLDPMPKRAVRFQKLLKERGECGHTWTTRPRGADEDAHTHTCRRYARHGSLCRCNCGTTRKAKFAASAGAQDGSEVL